VITAVFFDIGGTILDESREFETWADWFGVPRHTFSAVFGAVIARGQDWQETFRTFRPGFDLATELERRAAAGRPDNDAGPAQQAGMPTCLIRRGPWGHILDVPAVAERCLFRIDSLAELPRLVAEHNAGVGR
jgi:FMN phosphatase YigB (HAD superfamily)